MNKQLQTILTMFLALISTVSFAQDWSVDSRTRANMHFDNSMMLLEQRSTLATDMGGDNWGVHLSADVNYVHNDGSNGMVGLGLYEAYAETDLFGFASLTIGRQAWNFGSGALIGSNEWAAVRTTRDGLLLNINNDMVDLQVGYNSYNNGFEGEEDNSWSLINASKSFGDFTGNVLVISGDDGFTTTTATGLDLGYSAMGGSLDLNLGVNAVSQDDVEYDMTTIGATYTVSDDLSVHASQTTYGENGFTITSGTNMGYSDGGDNDSCLSHGNLGYLNADDVNLSVGLDYSMGDFDISGTMHAITNNSNENYEKAVTEINVAYNLNDNAALALKVVNDDRYNVDGENYMWLNLTVRP